MIPSSTILACVLTLCISLVIPLGILLVLGIRWRKDGFAPAWFIGAAGFFVCIGGLGQLGQVAVVGGCVLVHDSVFGWGYAPARVVGGTR